MSQRPSSDETKEENFDEIRPNFIRPTPILPHLSNNYFSDITAITGSHIFGKQNPKQPKYLRFGLFIK